MYLSYVNQTSHKYEREKEIKGERKRIVGQSNLIEQTIGMEYHNVNGISRLKTSFIELWNVND